MADLAVTSLAELVEESATENFDYQCWFCLEKEDVQTTKCKPHTKDDSLPIKVYSKVDQNLYSKDAVLA